MSRCEVRDRKPFEMVVEVVHVPGGESTTIVSLPSTVHARTFFEMVIQVVRVSGEESTLLIALLNEVEDVDASRAH